jgi:hypothetical protein
MKFEYYLHCSLQVHNMSVNIFEDLEFFNKKILN